MDVFFSEKIMKNLKTYMLLIVGMLCASQVSFADTMDDIEDGSNDVINGTMDATKEAGRATGKAIESTGKATKDVFQ